MLKKIRKYKTIQVFGLPTNSEVANIQLMSPMSCVCFFSSKSSETHAQRWMTCKSNYNLPSWQYLFKIPFFLRFSYDLTTPDADVMFSHQSAFFSFF